jgi:hypothetical protein
MELMEYSRSGLAAPAIIKARPRGRVRTADVAYGYRMGAGFAGQVTRTHPVSIEPGILDATTPPTFYGQACMINTAANSVRTVAAGDAALTSIYGVAVRPYPLQQSTTALAYGAVGFATSTTPPAVAAGQPIDVLRQGYILVPLYGGTAATKGAPVFVWYGATGGGHVLGGFEAGAGVSTMALTGYPFTCTFNGPADATTGLVELAFNI